MLRTVFGCALGVSLSGLAVDAHHSIASVYDGSRQVRVEGVVTEFRFVNPHPLLGIVVDDGSGIEQEWWLEMDNLSELAAIGMTRETLKRGDRVTISGSPARVEPRRLYIRRLDRQADGLVYEQVGATPRLDVAPR
jgi:hypothetical protein